MTTFKLKDEHKTVLNELRNTIHSSCIVRGFYSDLKTGKPLDRNIGEMIALCHSELSEALEGYRQNLMDDHLPRRKMIEVELADTIIRMLDLAGYLGLDIGGAVVEKFSYNQTREDHNMENRKKENGKKI